MPLFRIGSDKKCKHIIPDNPGPGQYLIINPDVIHFLFKRSNKFGIIGK